MPRVKLTLEERLAERMAERGIDETSGDHMEPAVHERQFPKVGKGTERKRENELAYLRFFLNWKRPGRGDHLIRKDSGELPTREEMKRFIYWRTSLIKKANIRAAKNRSRYTISWVQQLTDAQFSSSLWKEILGFISCDMVEDPKLGMTEKGWAKPTASLLNYRSLLQVVWSLQAGFRSARERLQFFFAALCMVVGACRPGEIGPGQDRADEDDALAYEDVESYLEVEVGEDGVERPQFFARVTHSRLKQRAQEGRWKESLLSQEDPLLSAFDPTIPFLALAFADGVFKLVDTPAQLEAIDVEIIKRAGGKLVLDYKPEKAKLLILRDIISEDGVWTTSPDHCFSYSSCKTILDRMFDALDYHNYEGRGFYVLRRMYMNLLEMAGVTETVLQQTVGHAPGTHTFSRSYKSKLISVDMQALIRGDKMREDRRVLGMGLQRKRGETTRLSGLQVKSLGDTPEITETRDELNKRCDEVYAEYPSMTSAVADGCPPALEFRRLERKLYTLQKQLEQNALDAVREAEYDELVTAGLGGLKSAQVPRKRKRPSDEKLEALPRAKRSVSVSTSTAGGSTTNSLPFNADSVIDPDLLEEDRLARAVLSTRVETATTAAARAASPETQYQHEMSFDTLPDERDELFYPLPLGQDDVDSLHWHPAGPILTQENMALINQTARDYREPSSENDEEKGEELQEVDEPGAEDTGALLDTSFGEAQEEPPVEHSNAPSLQRVLDSYQKHCDSASLPMKHSANSTHIMSTLFPQPSQPQPLSRSQLILAMSDPLYIATRGTVEEIPPKVGADMRCPVSSCGMLLKPTPAYQRSHTHDCLRKQLGKDMWACWSSAIEGLGTCPYSECDELVEDAESFAEHLLSHVTSETRTGSECGIQMAGGLLCGEINGHSYQKRVHHLEASHGLLALPLSKGETVLQGRQRFCFECFEWIRGLDNIETHAAGHLRRDLDWYYTEALSCQSDFSGKKDSDSILGLLRAKCSFCLFDSRLSAADRWFSTRATGTHLAHHINEQHLLPLALDKQTRCQFSCCAKEPDMTPSELANHLETAHLTRLTASQAARLTRIPIPDDLSTLLVPAPRKDKKKKLDKDEEMSGDDEELAMNEELEARSEPATTEPSSLSNKSKGKAVAAGEKKTKTPAVRAKKGSGDEFLRLTRKDLEKELSGKECYYGPANSVQELRDIVERLRSSEPLVEDRDKKWLRKEAKSRGVKPKKNPSREDFIEALGGSVRARSESSTPGPRTPRDASTRLPSVDVLDPIDEEDGADNDEPEAEGSHK